MAKHEKISKTGFVIKLSSDTVEKLSKEEQKSTDDKESCLVTGNTDKTINVIENVILEKNYGEQKQTQYLKTGEEFATEIRDLPAPKENHNISSKDEDTNITDSKWGDYAPYITYDGEQAIYTDPSSHQKYTWNKECNSWDTQPREVPERTYSYENDTHVYTEADGSKFFWDDTKKAWIPKVDDDFLAFYQMSYGFVENTSTEQKPEKKVEPKKLEQGVKRKNEAQWFQPSEENNTKVYVSNLPSDLTEEEFVNLMQKCGLVERDPHTQKMRVKLYMDKERNCFKGDALCTYIKIESVDLALKLLDGCDFKGQKITVERAHFQMKGEYNPALKPKKKKKKELDKLKKMQQKLFDWRPEKFIGERSKHEKVVIVKNLFSPSDFDNEVQLILDYQQDLREECGKCGEVRKVVIYDRHPEGVAQITMKEPEEADAVIQLINGRWFGKRQITAETWDGRTKYRIAETDAALNQRINKWDKFLEGTEEGKPADTLDSNTKSPESSEIKQSTNKTTSESQDETKEIL